MYESCSLQETIQKHPKLWFLTHLLLVVS